MHVAYLAGGDAQQQQQQRQQIFMNVILKVVGASAADGPCTTDRRGGHLPGAGAPRERPNRRPVWPTVAGGAAGGEKEAFQWRALVEAALDAAPGGVEDLWARGGAVWRSLQLFGVRMQVRQC